MPSAAILLGALLPVPLRGEKKTPPSLIPCDVYLSSRRGVGAGPVMPDFCELPSYRGLGGRL